MASVLLSEMLSLYKTQQNLTTAPTWALGTAANRWQLVHKLSVCGNLRL